MALDDIPLPTNLYRIRLCNGDEIYLLHHELDLMPQPYQILQVVGMDNMSETFNGGVVPTHGPDPGPPPPPAPRTDLFALKLDYYGAKKRNELFSANGFPTPEEGYKNGNIARMTWQVAGRDRQVYGFDYDNLDRLRNAAYADQTKDDYFYNHGLYRMDADYDLIGNIKALNRAGVVKECDPDGGSELAYGQIDALIYDYGNSQLKQVTDATGEDPGFRANGGGGQEYGYDRNGNMTTDQSKGLTALYNHLNLPRSVSMTGGGFGWTYDATGRKLKKTAPSCVECTTTTYAEGIEYHNGYQQDADGNWQEKSSVNISHPEGRLTYNQHPDDPDANYWQSEYSLRDHLGNVRLTFADKNRDGYIQIADDDPWFVPLPPDGVPDGYTEVLSEAHYYPFGMEMGGPWRQPRGADGKDFYGYNGKELDSDLGLDWMHYGFRMYLPEIGRFTGVDPLAAQFAGWSTYHYTYNNPVLFIDPDGRSAESTHIDEVGNVIAEYDDGDDGVYVHDSGTSKTEIDKQREDGANTGGDGNYIGELGGEIDVNEVYANLLQENKSTAKGMYNPFAFRDLVKNKGDWDLKNNKKTIYGLGNDGKTMFSFQGNLMEAQDIGNHHFGVVANAFGFPLETSLRQAGQAQMASGTSKSEWQKYKTYDVPGNWKTGSAPRTITKMVAPYGDDPRDQKWIISGYKY